jgi:hypothetical protein
MTTIILKGGAKIWVDLTLDRGRCKGCRKQIYWASTENGKKMPICKDDNGIWISHFYNCPKSDSFRKKDPLATLTNGVDTDERKLPKIV